MNSIHWFIRHPDWTWLIAFGVWCVGYLVYSFFKGIYLGLRDVRAYRRSQREQL